MLNRWFCLMICLIYTLYGCSKSVKYVDFTTLNSQQWHINEPKFFIYNNHSSHIGGDIFLCLNYTNLENAQDLTVELEVQPPTKKMWSTKYLITLETTSRVGRIETKKEIKLIENCEFADIGAYKFRVKQTSTPTLKGVSSIGIAIK